MQQGTFSDLTKFEKGTVRSIIIPGEDREEAWRKFYSTLKNILDGLHVFQLHDYRLNQMAEDQQPSGERRQLRMENVERKEREWGKAVVFFRESIDTAWKEVAGWSSETLNRRCWLHTLGVDRALLWCKNEEEVKWLEAGSRLLADRVGRKTVCVHRWRQDIQSEDKKIIAKNRWIAVEGLPLHMWNAQVFEEIGARCGGLLEVARGNPVIEIFTLCKT